MVVWALLIACAKDEGPEAPVTPTPPAEDDTALDGPPFIDEAIADRCPDEPDVASAGDSMYALTLSGTTCNDGTPGVVYIRAASDPAHRNDWVLGTEGGGACNNHQACARRWCNATTRPRMTGGYEVEKDSLYGIQSPLAVSAFAGWNHASFHYCSSDLWLGRKPDHLMEGNPTFRIHMTGHELFLEGLDVLDRGAVSDGGNVVMPSLTDASTLVFSGASAGAQGVAQHLDLVAERYAGAQVVGLIDSYFAPEVDSYVDRLTHVWDLYVDVYDLYVDESCRQHHVDDPWRCLDVMNLFTNHIATPFVLHHDMRDPIHLETYAPHGFSPDDYASASADALRRLAGDRPDLAMHGAVCGQHTSIASEEWFREAPVVDAESDASWTLHEMLLGLLDGTPAVAIDHPDGRGSTCPE